MNLLITGAGGSAAISFFNAITHMTEINVYMADMDQYSTGLYLVPPENRAILPAGDNEGFAKFVLSLCIRNQINAVIPTVDSELAPLASEIESFTKAGIKIVTSSCTTLLNCYDKFRLMELLTGCVPLVQYSLLEEKTPVNELEFPLIAKPRSGSGSRGIVLVNNLSDLDTIVRDGSYMLQEYLPGKEYSVDVFVDKNGEAIANVIRERIKVDSGIAVISKTIVDEEISDMAVTIALKVGIRYVANIQFKLDRNNKPRLLEINPRFPGTMPLTVAAGVNMPELCIREIRGEKLTQIKSYKSLAMVRSWKETYLPASEFENQWACHGITV